MKQRVNSEEAMHRLAGIVARHIPDGACLNLIGDVGAGKTTFTKGFAKMLGVGETVQSPTFTISRVYDLPDHRRLVHYDFYRLSEPGIMAEELKENLSDDAIVVIEWGDIVADVVPEDSLTLRIVSVSESEREIEFEAGGTTSSTILKGVTDACAA